MLILCVGLVTRLKGINDPLLDHPGWRQGDTAAIARNFALLEYNIFRPQTDYNGAPPHYVELELQIVPFLAATLYKLFGIHEIFGRLISVAFSLGTILLLGVFARRLAREAGWSHPEIAGFSAAFLFAAYPGSTYYGRTFMPDTTMVFFLTAALYATVRWMDDEHGTWGKGSLAAAGLTALALLAKPVAIIVLFPIAAVMFARWGVGGTLRRPQTYAFLIIALLPPLCYDRYIASIAEWHWASGITRLHVLPALTAAFTSWNAMRVKLRIFRAVLGLLPGTMLGPWCTALFVLAVVGTWKAPRSRPLLFGWLAGCLIYAFVVMTYERVDYYFYVFLPLAALWSGLFIGQIGVSALSRARTGGAYGVGALGGLGVLAAGALVVANQAPVRAYYHYNTLVYRAAKALDAKLAPGALVVMGHYDPSLLYYINRKGWEEDPYLWTPFNEQSAIHKGARYYIAVEENRLRRNVELYAWLQRFPLIKPKGKWPVYETEYVKVLPGSEERWRAFRRGEKRRSYIRPGT